MSKLKDLIRRAAVAPGIDSDLIEEIVTEARRSGVARLSSIDGLSREVERLLRDGGISLNVLISVDYVNVTMIDSGEISRLSIEATASMTGLAPWEE